MIQDKDIIIIRIPNATCEPTQRWMDKANQMIEMVLQNHPKHPIIIYCRENQTIELHRK